jgi:hypothetical protein
LKIFRGDFGIAVKLQFARSLMQNKILQLFFVRLRKDFVYFVNDIKFSGNAEWRPEEH